LRRVDPTPPLGLDVMVTIEGPTRSLGLRYPLAQGRRLLGCLPACDICVPHRSVEPHHCEIEVRGDQVTVVALEPMLGPIKIDGVNMRGGAFPRGSRLEVGYIVFQRFEAGAVLPPESVARLELPVAVLERVNRNPDLEPRITKTHRVFYGRSPAPSPYMLDVRQGQRANIQIDFERIRDIVTAFTRMSDVTAARLGEFMAVEHELRTQLEIIDGAPLEDVVRDSLLPVFDWEAKARARIESCRRG
jgi:hypothetical protein